jgi:hypothetical protein
MDISSSRSSEAIFPSATRSATSETAHKILSASKVEAREVFVVFELGETL